MMRQVRPIRIHGDVAYVPLTRGYEAIIDAADVPLVEGFNWIAFVRPHTVYVISSRKTGNTPSTIYLHRLIMGAPVGLEVDHVDCNGLNNRRNNLRFASKSQNAHNQRIRSNNRSGVKGVSFNKKRGLWVAHIKIQYKSRTIGSFRTIEEASAAYAAASAALHGEYGRTA